jgi:hypothetical protein
MRIAVTAPFDPVAFDLPPAARVSTSCGDPGDGGPAAARDRSLG